jgi:hypothetical protein
LISCLSHLVNKAYLVSITNLFIRKDTTNHPLDQSMSINNYVPQPKFVPAFCNFIYYHQLTLSDSPGGVVRVATRIFRSDVHYTTEYSTNQRWDRSRFFSIDRSNTFFIDRSDRSKIWSVKLFDRSIKSFVSEPIDRSKTDQMFVCKPIDQKSIKNRSSRLSVKWIYNNRDICSQYLFTETKPWKYQIDT